MEVEIVGGKREMLADRGVGTLGRLQCSVFIVDGAVAFTAEEAVLEGMVVSGMRAGLGFELHELMSGEGCGAKQGTEERLQFGLEWVSDI